MDKSHEFNPSDNQDKGVLVNKIEEMHPSGGNLYEGGTDRVGKTVTDTEKTAIAYTLENSNAMRGGMRSSGITERLGVNVFDGEKEIVVKKISIWRDGENSHNDDPTNHYSIKEFKKTGDKEFELVLIDNVDEIEVIKVDFKSGTVERKEKLKLSKYMEKKEGKSPRETYDLIRQKLDEIINSYNPRGFNVIDYAWALDNTGNLEYIPYDGIDSKKSKEVNSILESSKEKILLFKTSEASYGVVKTKRLFEADIKSGNVKELKAWNGRKEIESWYKMGKFDSKTNSITLLDLYDKIVDTIYL